jgi:hypothetical protein
MLKELRRRGVVEFERLRRYIIRRAGTDGEVVFMSALNLLFLLDRLDYHLKNDTLEYKLPRHAD